MNIENWLSINGVIAIALFVGSGFGFRYVVGIYTTALLIRRSRLFTQLAIWPFAIISTGGNFAILFVAAREMGAGSFDPYSLLGLILLFWLLWVFAVAFTYAFALLVITIIRIVKAFTDWVDP